MSCKNWPKTRCSQCDDACEEMQNLPLANLEEAIAETIKDLTKEIERKNKEEKYEVSDDA